MLFRLCHWSPKAKNTMQNAPTSIRCNAIAFGLLTAFSLGAEAAAGEITLTVAEPSGVERSEWPVTSGVPLAQGELRSHRQTALFDAAGQEIPLQTEVLARWPDGTIRWLLLDFQVDLAAGQSKRFLLRYGPRVERSTNPHQSLVITRGSKEYPITPRIETGPLRVQLSTDHFRLLDDIWLDLDGDGRLSDDERMTDDRTTGIVLVAADGRRHRADLSLATWTIERHGPLRACVRIEGRHGAEDGSAMFRYIVRLHVFRGQPFIKFDYTFVNDYQGAMMAKFDAIEIVCSIKDDGDQFILNGEPSKPSRLVQIDDREFQISGRTSDGRAPGWAAVASPRGGLAAGVREFWQNWPKSLEVKPGELRIGLCPDFPKGQYDGRPLLEEVKHHYYLRDGVYSLKTGTARTHEVWATFFSGEPQAGKLAEFFRAAEKPLLAQCSPEHVCSTGILGDAPPADPKKYKGYDALLDAMFQKHLDDQESIREYGMLNFGDWYHVDKFGGGWANQEYDTSHIFFVQYLRSGDRRYFDRARQGAEHLMDVDVLHAVNRHMYGEDGHGQPQVGQIWTHSVGHTGGYYEGAALRAPVWYQRGLLADDGHVWIGGMCDNYLLTGNRRALDVARTVADNIASGQIDAWSDHVRGLGWPLNLLMTAWETTGDDKYLDAAGRQWHTLREHLDPEKGFVVMLAFGHCTKESTSERCRGQVTYFLALTLSALARYHRATGDPEVLRGLSIGLDQMIRESWDAEAKTFWATSCKHIQATRRGLSYPTVLLSSLAFGHTIKHTGNQEHRRIFREGVETAMKVGQEQLRSGDPHAQAAFAGRWFHFAPYGLKALMD